MPEVHIILNQPERAWNAPAIVQVFMEKTPPRIEFLGAIYSQITDPETGEFLNAYSAYPTDDTPRPQREEKR